MSTETSACQYVFDPEEPEEWAATPSADCKLDDQLLNGEGVWTCPHSARSDATDCVFHAPLDEVPAEEKVSAFLETISSAIKSDDSETRARTLEFVGAQFGDFELQHRIPVGDAGLVLAHATVDGTMDWSNSTLEVTLLDCSGITVTGTMGLTGVECTGKFSADGARFEQELVLGRSSFDGRVSLTDANCDGLAVWKEAEFGGDLLCDNAEFDSLSVMDIVVTGTTDFQGASFASGTAFDEATFRGDVDFRDITADKDCSFAGATAEGVWSMGGATFQAQCSLDEIEIHDRLDCSEVTFGDWTYLRHADVHREANFQDSEFETGCQATGATFRGSTEFAGIAVQDDFVCESVQCQDTSSFEFARFGGNVIFEDSSFGGDVDFTAVDISGIANFEQLSIAGESDWSNATFSKTTTFLDGTFGGDAVFERAEFDSVVFNHTTFQGRAKFRSATFAAKASFQDSTFEKAGSFKTATFSGTVAYSRATFGGTATFYKTVFEDDATFYDVTFEYKAKYSSAEFQGELTFGESTFEDACNLFDAECAGEADFQQAEFRGGKQFAGVTFADGIVFRDNTLDGANFFSADMAGATFINTSCRQVIFKDAHLENAQLEGTDLSGADLEQAKLTDANLFGANLSGAKLYGARIGEAVISTETILDGHGDARCVYDPNGPYKYDPDDDEAVGPIRKAMGAYHTLEQLTRANALPTKQSQYFARRQDMRREQLRRDESFPKLNYWFATLQNLVFRHGESFSRVVACSLGTIVLFALVFPLGGWLTSEATGPVTYERIAASPSLFWESLYHSTLLFLSGGGPMQTTGFVGELLTTAEAIIAPILLALVVFVLGRRAAR